MTTTAQHWTFKADESAPALARLAASSLAHQVPHRRLADILLLVSELVTNSVRHAGLNGSDRIGLVVDIDGETVRVEVRDPGPGFEPRSLSPKPHHGSGWGLHLVQLLADRWGVDTTDAETVTWFELAV
ncbi:MAG TPA: ATP-binding protein [Acidimicrobiia bacterium]|nr:ATP-binding protein [Acidimicrobiia bacterium]